MKRLLRLTGTFALFGCATVSRFGSDKPAVMLAGTCFDSTATGMTGPCPGFVVWTSEEDPSLVATMAITALQADGFAVGDVDTNSTAISVLTEVRVTWPEGIKPELHDPTNHPGLIVRVTATKREKATEVIIATDPLRRVRMVSGTSPEAVLTLYTLTIISITMDSLLSAAGAS